MLLWDPVLNVATRATGTFMERRAPTMPIWQGGQLTLSTDCTIRKA